MIQTMSIGSTMNHGKRYNEIEPVTTDIMHYLDAGNTDSYPGSGNTWSDLSVNGNDATFQGTTAPYDSADGGSFDFEGGTVSTDYFNVPYASTLAPGEEWSVMYWINVAGTSAQYVTNLHANDFAVLAGYQALATNIYMDGYRITETPNYALDEWNCFGYTKGLNAASNNLHVYKNGIEQAEETLSYTVPVSSNSMRIGSTGTSAAQFQGKLAVWMFYQRELSGAEVLQNHNYYASRFGL